MEKAYADAIDAMKEELRENWRDDLKDKMLQQRREWYLAELA